MEGDGKRRGGGAMRWIPARPAPSSADGRSPQALEQETMMRRTFVCWSLAATLLACAPEDAPTATEIDLSAARDAVATRYQELGVPEAEWMPTVYRYPEALAAGTEVFDAAGRSLLVAPAGALYWVDLEPTARWPRRDRLKK